MVATAGESRAGFLEWGEECGDNWRNASLVAAAQGLLLLVVWCLWG